jgi:hypothetical protein
VRRVTLASLAASLVLVTAAAAVPALGPEPRAGTARTTIFYYPWWGTPAHDGDFVHWSQNGALPPDAIASAFYPARGPYSSRDGRVLKAHMRDIRRAGVDQLATSWWGWGSVEDRHLPAILGAARAARLDVAVHIEPYEGRTPASVAADIAHLRELGIVDFYVYGAEATPAAEWANATAAIDPVARVFAQTGLAGFAAAGGFDGLYTYDILVYGGPRFARLCEQARRKQLLCAPSVGPGFNALRAAGDLRLKPRRQGRTYDGMWRAAIGAGADIVTVTSYNEWHEGTQIEPARARLGFGGYEGAWGLSGAAAEYAYVDRTAYWTQRFNRALSRGAGGTRA